MKKHATIKPNTHKKRTIPLNCDEPTGQLNCVWGLHLLADATAKAKVTLTNRSLSWYGNSIFVIGAVHFTPILLRDQSRSHALREHIICSSKIQLRGLIAADSVQMNDPKPVEWGKEQETLT